MALRKCSKAIMAIKNAIKGFSAMTLALNLGTTAEVVDKNSNVKEQLNNDTKSC